MCKNDMTKVSKALIMFTKHLIYYKYIYLNIKNIINANLDPNLRDLSSIEALSMSRGLSVIIRVIKKYRVPLISVLTIISNRQSTIIKKCITSQKIHPHMIILRIPNNN